MHANVHLVKSFTQNPEQGSPTGVVLDAGNLAEGHMQYIATELNFAESVFVQPEPDNSAADYRLRFFAPKGEVNLCGHATIAAFHTLKEQGRITIDEGADSIVLAQETRAGTLGVTCHADGRIVMRQNDPEFMAVEHNRGRIASMLGFTTIPDLMSDRPIEIVSTGTPKLLIPLSDSLTLAYARPNLEAIRNYCEETGARGFYPFAPQSTRGADFVARQFNPLADDNEDPITGVAAGALGAYAGKYALLGNRQQMVVQQGYRLGMGGDMFVDISDGIRVGGYAVTYGEKFMPLPDVS